MIEAAEQEISNVVEAEPAERRRHPRYPFSATVEATEPKSRAKIQGRTADLAIGGCYVDTISPFPVGTAIKLRLMNENQSCDTQAKVVYSLPGMGMGLTFVHGAKGQASVISRWVSELSGEPEPEIEESETEQQEIAAKPSANEPFFVLNELLIELMRQGVLSDSKGKEMLQRLR